MIFSPAELNGITNQAALNADSGRINDYEVYPTADQISYQEWDAIQLGNCYWLPGRSAREVNRRVEFLERALYEGCMAAYAELPIETVQLYRCAFV